MVIHCVLRLFSISFLKMLLLLVILLVVAVAEERNDSSTPFDLESEMPTEMFTERSVGGSNSNSDDPSFNNSTESIVKRFSFILDEPHLESTESNITVLLSNSANLYCRVGSLGEKLVTWVRQEEGVILAVGKRVIARDSRITSIHFDKSGEWNLEIRSTNLYIQRGTDLKLTCVINGGASRLINVAWFEGNYNMNRYSSSFYSYTQDTGSYYASRLRIVSSRHSGNYTCKPSNADPASISVHVLNGRNPETTTVEPVTTTVEPVSTTVTVLHGQQSSSAFRFMPFPLLHLLLPILWMLKRLQMLSSKVISPPYQDIRRA